MENRLWYETCPKEWMEGLPIGNGRLAAMVWGNESTDRLSLNHEWLWRGVYRNRDIEPAAEHLREVRDCLKKGDFFRATSLANVYFGGFGGLSGIPCRVDSYQPAGDLCFTLADCEAFLRRELDIENAVATAKRAVGESRVHSAFIAHPGCGLIICRWSAESGRFSGTLRYSRVEDANADVSCVYTSNGIAFSCAFAGGIQYRTTVEVRTDGEAIAMDGSFEIHNATGVTAFINIATGVKGIERELANYPVPQSGWDDLLESHSRVFRELLGRMSLRVSLPESALPTDKRVELARAGGEDTALSLLYFNYGRYLLASSSICGELPANLQGKWNDRIDPPWECDYHFDINLQMNYWMAEAAAMPECADAMIRYLENFLPHARKAAKDLYGCRGILLPLQTDAWGRSTPESFGWGVWIGAAPWAAQHLWRHYEYSGDTGFLRNRAYPFFREVAEFYEDYLVEDETGALQIMPSQSPENRFRGTGLWPVSIGVSSAMDVQLAYDALGYAIRSSEILGVDVASARKWREMRDSLPPFRIASDGRLLEWDRECEEIEPGHRHLSHLYGLYPSDLFNPIDRPKQYDAAVKSLEYRLAQGGGHTGWSRAWTACLYARAGNSGKAWEHLNALITDFATASLLDLHPPRVFQIDGNLGASEAVLQCLAQCWGGKVHLLRALPAHWPEGSLEGVKTPGGHRLSFRWSGGRLNRVEITFGYGERIVLAGLAGKFAIPENAIENHGDLEINGTEGMTVTLVNAAEASNSKPDTVYPF